MNPTQLLQIRIHGAVQEALKNGVPPPLAIQFLFIESLNVYSSVREQAGLKITPAAPGDVPPINGGRP